jgi:hypothetical protein
MSQLDPFHLTVAEIQRLIIPGTPCLPELETARRDLETLRCAPQTQAMLAQSQTWMESLEQIPFPTFTSSCMFTRTGDRTSYETPYFGRRARLSAATLRLFLGQSDLKDIVQDYVWAICEETDWVLPAHETLPIDLFSAETAFLLAEVLDLLGETLEAPVRARVRATIEQRIFDPYLRYWRSHWWYQDHTNWNSVCNSSIAATFMLLETEPGRVARALELALAGLRFYMDTAFEKDGSSTEGVGYWQYGLINFIALSEMLRARTNGALDLLDSDHLRKIAAYPAKLLLSANRFAAFSDCEEPINFNPGIIARLMERTGESSLANLLTALVPPPVPAERDWRLTMWLRNMLWWNGQRPKVGPISDAYLPFSGVARLTAQTPQGLPVVLAIKAGHNDENHNHNDVGSFVLHVDGETFLTDPGRGLYTRQYFRSERYDNIFANSYGHSVPRMGGQLQPPGRQFRGEITSVETNAPVKRVDIEFAGAYAAPNLASARRQITLEQNGVTCLSDIFHFSATPVEIEEALVTWLDVQTSGSTAVICGERHALRLTVDTPAGVCLQVERLEEHSQANAKPQALKRLKFTLPVSAEAQARIRIEIV